MLLLASIEAVEEGVLLFCDNIFCLVGLQYSLQYLVVATWWKVDYILQHIDVGIPPTTMGDGHTKFAVSSLSVEREKYEVKT